jgi:2-iminobutanoate/2-iminopropanoate deaminase
MKKILFAVVAGWSFLCSGLLFGLEPGSVEFLNSGKVLPTNLPFSEAVRVGNTVYLSGQIGIVPGTMKLASGGIKVEARQTMENIKSSLEAHGYSMSNIVTCTVMLADILDWGAFNEVYRSFFLNR